MNRTRTASIILITTCLVASACSGGDDEAAPTTTESTVAPTTEPAPTTTEPAPIGNSLPHPASGLSSRNGVSGSTSCSIRSRCSVFTARKRCNSP